VVSFTQPGHGTLTREGDGVFTYTPTAVGQDQVQVALNAAGWSVAVPLILAAQPPAPVQAGQQGPRIGQQSTQNPLAYEITMPAVFHLWANNQLRQAIPRLTLPPFPNLSRPQGGEQRVESQQIGHALQTWFGNVLGSVGRTFTQTALLPMAVSEVFALSLMANPDIGTHSMSLVIVTDNQGRWQRVDLALSGRQQLVLEFPAAVVLPLPGGRRLTIPIVSATFAPTIVGQSFGNDYVQGYIQYTFTWRVGAALSGTIRALQYFRAEINNGRVVWVVPPPRF
jgi:hypothetical protein